MRVTTTDKELIEILSSTLPELEKMSEDLKESVRHKRRLLSQVETRIRKLKKAISEAKR